jgi:hypothetical protein
VEGEMERWLIFRGGRGKGEGRRGDYNDSFFQKKYIFISQTTLIDPVFRGF